MQTANVNLPITITGRNVNITEEMRQYARKKVESLHLDYPRIIEARVILDVQNSFQYFAEVVLYCANHITIEASSTTEDCHASIDETMSKIARRMRKYKTRMLKRTHRPRKGQPMTIAEAIYTPELSDVEPDEDESVPYIVHKESYRLRPLFVDEAIMEMEMNDRPFLMFQNQKSHRLAVIYRKDNGDYALVEPQDIPDFSANGSNGSNGSHPVESGN